MLDDTNGNESIKRRELARKMKVSGANKGKKEKRAHLLENQLSGWVMGRVKKNIRELELAGAAMEMQHAFAPLQRCCIHYTRQMLTLNTQKETQNTQREGEREHSTGMEKSIFTFCPCPGFSPP